MSYPIYQNPTDFPYKAYLAWYVESTVFSTSLWLHLTLELLSIPSRTVVQRFSIDIYWLTADIYWLTAFLTSSHCPHSSKLFPTSDPAHMVLSPCQTLPSPGLAPPFSSTPGIWNVHLFKPSSCSVTASFSFLQSTYPMWDYLFVCLFNVSSSNQHLRSILSFGSLANTQPAKISAWLINRCLVTCYWTAAERCQLPVEE